MAMDATGAPKGPSPPRSNDSTRSRRSPQKPHTPRTTRSSSSSSKSVKPEPSPYTPMQATTSATPSQQHAPQMSPSKPRSEPRRRKPVFVSCLSYPESAPVPPPTVKVDAELQRSQRKSKVEALNKLDRAGTPTAVVAGPAATSFVPPRPPPAGPSVQRNPLKRNRPPNPPFDLGSVRTTPPPDPGPSNGESRMFGLPSCPAYHPTAEQFQDPMAYIESIAPEAKKYGICKIIPPEGWQMPFELETDTFRFMTRLQRLNSIEAASRAKINFLEQLSMFHKQQGDANAYIPRIEHRLLDLWLLRKEVNKRGGTDEVNRLKAWAQITELLGFGPSATPQVRAAYTRIILPFENWALRAKAYPESPITPLPSANGKPAPGSVAQASPATPSASAPPVGKMGNMRTSPRGRMSAVTPASNSSLTAAMTMGGNNGQAGPSTRSASTSGASTSGLSTRSPANGSLGPPASIKITIPPGFSGHGSDSELSEDESSLTSHNSTPEQKPEKYEKGDVCEICSLGNNAAKILLCDGCDRGFHTFCLEPPLQSVPSNEWYCTACLLGTGDDYGFDEGEEHSLPSFQARDTAFGQAWFNRYAPPEATSAAPGPLTRTIGNAVVSEAEVEREFWRLVESQDDTVEVEYGADVHSTTHGSGAPTLETNPLSPYARDPWNLNNMAILKNSLLRYIKSDISGMTVPWIYVGMLFSAFCWHNEDHYTYSVNYMFWGETKTWYGIPGADAEKFETAIKREAPELFDRQPSLLYQLVTMMNPGRLKAEGVDVFACDQRPNEFVITFPKAYHCGFNHGLNFNEAVNFALPDWLPAAKESVVRYSQHAKAPVFSHDELLVTITLYSDTIKTAIWLLESLNEMTEEESARRKQLRETVPGLAETLAEEDVPEEQYQCYVCKNFCYLSQVTCTCTNMVACIDHAELLCSCPWEKRTLRKRYSENQLEDICQTVAARAVQPQQWQSRLDTLLETSRPPLKTVRQLLADGERIPYRLDGVEDLRAFVDRANQWVERAAAISTRKTVGRRRKGRQSEVRGDDDDIDRSPEALRELLEEADQLAFDAPEIAQLRQTLQSIENFRHEASTILSTRDEDLKYDQCNTALIVGQSLSSALPEVAQLAKVVSRLKWYHKVEEEVDDRTLQYGDIVKLLKEAQSWGVPSDHRAVVELRKREQKGREWKDAVDKLLASKTISLDAVSALIEGQEYTPTSIETMRNLESLRKTALTWQQNARSLLSNRGTVAAATRLCKAVRSAHGPQSRIDIPEIATLQAELDFTRQWIDGVADVLDVPQNKVNTSLTTLLREVEDHMASGDNEPNEEHTCFCRSSPTNTMLTCTYCHGAYHPKCVGVSARAAPPDFRCQMCQDLQYNDRPSFNTLGVWIDPLKWNFVLRVPEYEHLARAVDVALRFARMCLPVMGFPEPSAASRDPVLISHFLRKIWTLPVQVDAQNMIKKEIMVFEKWLYRRLREAIDGVQVSGGAKGGGAAGGRSRARKPKFTLEGAHPHEFACLCTTEPLDHLLKVTCSKCEQGFHLSCAKAPISVANTEGRAGWRCPFCTIKAGKAPPRNLDLRIQMEDKIGTDEYVDWRKTLFVYADDPIPVHLPANPDALVLICTRFSAAAVPDGFERPTWVERGEEDGRRKRRKTDQGLLPLPPSASPAPSNGSGASAARTSTTAQPTKRRYTSATNGSPVPAATPGPSSTTHVPAAPSAPGSVSPAVRATSTVTPSPNQPAQNTRANGRHFYPTHSIVPWSNSQMFSQFQLAPNGGQGSSSSHASPQTTRASRSPTSTSPALSTSSIPRAPAPTSVLPTTAHAFAPTSAFSAAHPSASGGAPLLNHGSGIDARPAAPVSMAAIAARSATVNGAVVPPRPPPGMRYLPILEPVTLGPSSAVPPRRQSVDPPRPAPTAAVTEAPARTHSAVASAPPTNAAPVPSVVPVPVGSSVVPAAQTANGHPPAPAPALPAPRTSAVPPVAPPVGATIAAPTARIPSPESVVPAKRSLDPSADLPDAKRPSVAPASTTSPLPTGDAALPALPATAPPPPAPAPAHAAPAP